MPVNDRPLCAFAAENRGDTQINLNRSLNSNELRSLVLKVDTAGEVEADKKRDILCLRLAALGSPCMKAFPAALYRSIAVRSSRSAPAVSASACRLLTICLITSSGCIEFFGTGINIARPVRDYHPREVICG